MIESGYLSSVGAEDSFGSYISRSACSLFGRMLCESSTFSISHFAPLVTIFDKLWPSILSRLRSKHYSPTNYLTPTRLPARICASLRSFKCGDSAARPAACSFTYLRVKKIPTPFGVGIFLTGSYLSSQAASSQVLSTYKGLTTVFGMGTGGSP